MYKYRLNTTLEEKAKSILGQMLSNACEFEASAKDSTHDEVSYKTALYAVIDATPLYYKDMIVKYLDKLDFDEAKFIKKVEKKIAKNWDVKLVSYYDFYKIVSEDNQIDKEVKMIALAVLQAKLEKLVKKSKDHSWIKEAIEQIENGKCVLKIGSVGDLDIVLDDSPVCVLYKSSRMILVYDKIDKRVNLTMRVDRVRQIRYSADLRYPLSLV